MVVAKRLAGDSGDGGLELGQRRLLDDGIRRSRRSTRARPVAEQSVFRRLDARQSHHAGNERAFRSHGLGDRLDRRLLFIRSHSGARGTCRLCAGRMARFRLRETEADLRVPWSAVGRRVRNGGLAYS